MAHLLLFSKRRLWCLFYMAVVGVIVVLLFFSRFCIRRRTYIQAQRDAMYYIEILRDARYRAEAGTASVIALALDAAVKWNGGTISFRTWRGIPQ